MGLRVAWDNHGDGLSKCGFRCRPVPVEPVTDRAKQLSSVSAKSSAEANACAAAGRAFLAAAHGRTSLVIGLVE